MDKKEIKKQYQEQKTIGGIFVLENTITGKLFLKSSYHLTASKNFIEFSKKIGQCPEAVLEEDWNTYGQEAFQFHVLEELERGEEQSRKAFGEDLKELEAMWLEKLADKIFYTKRES